MTWLTRWKDRRARDDGIAPVLLSLGVFLTMLALWGTWTGYTRVETTRSTLAHVVNAGLASGLITPITQGGGYMREAYGGHTIPQWNVTGVVQQAARFARATVSGSQTTLTATGYRWTLPAADQLRWDLAGSVVVTNVHITHQAPFTVMASVTAPLAVSLWGVARIPATLHLAIAIPVAGQQAPHTFQSY